MKIKDVGIEAARGLLTFQEPDALSFPRVIHFGVRPVSIPAASRRFLIASNNGKPFGILDVASASKQFSVRYERDLLDCRHWFEIEPLDKSLGRHQDKLHIRTTFNGGENVEIRLLDVVSQ